MILFWIIISIIIFSIIVLIHEYGHFKTARIFWVRVEEFWLGIPPRAKKIFTDKSWTLFSLNWLPLGWFVKLTWENLNTFRLYDKEKKLYDNERLEQDLKNKKDIFDKDWNKIWEKLKEEITKKLKDNNASYNLVNKPYWQQAIVILAWVFMNFLLAIIIFSILFFFWVKPIWINTKIETDLPLKLIPNYKQSIESWLLSKKPWIVLNPIKNSIAEKAWIKPWDIVTKFVLEDDEIIVNKVEKFINIISNNPWKEISFLVKQTYLEPSEIKTPKKTNLKWQFNWEKIREILVIPWKNGKIWSYVWENIEINTDFRYKYGFLEAIKNWVLETYNQSLLVFKALGILIKKIFNPEKPSDRQEAIDNLAGPIWIVDFISNSLKAWVVFLIIIWAIISINLWVFNLLPIPALDWWRFIFIVINSTILKLFWKKAINWRVEWTIHICFFVFLIILSIFIWYNDVNKILNN